PIDLHLALALADRLARRGAVARGVGGGRRSRSVQARQAHRDLERDTPGHAAVGLEPRRPLVAVLARERELARLAQPDDALEQRAPRRGEAGDLLAQLGHDGAG